MYWCIKKSYSLKYNITKKYEIWIFGVDLKFWSFFKMKQLICKKIYILKTHIYSIIIKKKHVMHWGIFKYFLEQVTKKFIQESICVYKLSLGKKTCNPFSK